MVLLVNQLAGFGAFRDRPADPAEYGIEALDNVYAVHGVARMLTSWAGALVRLRRSADSAQLDFRPNYFTGFLNKAEISQWLNGSTGFVTTIYDQTGNGRDWTQTTNGNQPAIDLTGSHPVIVFDGGDYMRATSMVGFTNAQSAVSIALVVSYLTSFDSSIAFGPNTGGNARALLQMGNSGEVRMFGSAVDATQVVANTITGVTLGQMYVEIGRWDPVNGDMFHRLGSSTASVLTWSGSGAAFPASDSTVAHLGANVAAGGPLANGSRFAASILTRDKLSDTEDSDLATSLAALIPS